MANKYLIEYTDYSEPFSNSIIEIEATDSMDAWRIAEGELCQAGEYSSIEILCVEEA